MAAKQVKVAVRDDHTTKKARKAVSVAESCTVASHPTNSMELSHSGEAACHSVTQEFPNALWNPKVHYRDHKGSPLVPVLSQINLLQTTPSYLSTIRLNITPPHTSRSSLFLSFWLSHRKSYMHSSSPACVLYLLPIDLTFGED
jgi:hypothetical protein